MSGILLHVLSCFAANDGSQGGSASGCISNHSMPVTLYYLFVYPGSIGS